LIGAEGASGIYSEGNLLGIEEISNFRKFCSILKTAALLDDHLEQNSSYLTSTFLVTLRPEERHCQESRLKYRFALDTQGVDQQNIGTWRTLNEEAIAAWHDHTEATHWPRNLLTGDAQTETTTTTTDPGTITEYSPGSTFVVKETSGAVSYHYRDKVTYVTWSAKTLIDDKGFANKARHNLALSKR
jgi:hypothetical protein